MAKGCNLLYSSEDRENFPLPSEVGPTTQAELGAQLGRFDAAATSASPIVVLVDGRVALSVLDAAALGIGRDIRSCFGTRIAELSPNGSAALAKIVTDQPRIQEQLVKGIGNPTLDARMAQALPTALADICGRHPSVRGLFEKGSILRGKFQHSWISRLPGGGKNQANGAAYEVLMAAKLCRSAIGNLAIRGGDTPLFGQKAQTSYGGEFTVKERTVEADLLICRPGEEIAVDFKFTGDSKTTLRDGLLARHLSAISTGEWTESHFVTNAEFSATTHAAVAELNADIAENLGRTSGAHAVHLHEYASWS